MCKCNRTKGRGECHLRFRCIARSWTRGDEEAERARERVRERARRSSSTGSSPAQLPTIPLLAATSSGSAVATAYLRNEQFKIPTKQRAWNTSNQIRSCLPHEYTSLCVACQTKKVRSTTNWDQESAINYQLFYEVICSTQLHTQPIGSKKCAKTIAPHLFEQHIA